jgi:hypothetical protein
MPRSPIPLPSHPKLRISSTIVLIAGLVALVADIGFDLVKNLDGAGIRLNRAAAAEVRAVRTSASVRSTRPAISSILANGGDHFSLSVNRGTAGSMPISAVISVRATRT